jgi:hypothetical protein
MARRTAYLRFFPVAAFRTVFIVVSLFLGFILRAQAAGTVSTCNEANLDTALVGGGNVTFSCDGTIAITSSKTIAIDTTVDATGHSVIISGNDQRRLFTVNAGIVANFVGLTLSDGSSSAGGAIASNGTLTIANCTLSSSSSTSLSGGAIRINAGTANITNSSFLSNSATNTASAGAIYVNVSSGLVNISNSTFAGNVASGTGGAIRNDGTVNIINSTFTSNAASGNLGGAISTLGGATTITNSIFFNSFTSNGGSVYRSGASTTLAISNSILFNFNSGSECVSVNGGAITDGGYNLSKDASCGFTATGSLQNVTLQQLSLGLFGSYGGPTQTIPPRPSSIAVDAIPAAMNGCGTSVTTDQRGIVRPQREKCDIGAVEVQYRVPPKLISE